MIVSVKPNPDLASRIAIPNGIKADKLHMTLAFMGYTFTQEDYTKCTLALRDVCSDIAPFWVELNEVGRFELVEVVPSPSGLLVEPPEPQDVLLARF